MEFIERWLHVSPDNGNGSLEFFIVAVAALIIISIGIVLRQNLSKLFWWYVEQMGDQPGGDRFDI